jgi:PiT family inorganic phosphate transporter
VVELLLVVGLAVAVFVGFNIGGSNTGVAFGPAVGSRTISKLGAGVLMSGFALLGGWTVGRRVVTTLGSDLVTGEPFSLAASVVILLFVGLALFVSNVFGVPASTSMTAVGAVAGYGLATDRLAVGVTMGIVSWWLVAPLLGFWISGVVGRYFYDDIAARVAVERSEGSLLTLDRDGSGALPRPALGEGTTRREVAGSSLVVLIGCYMAFSAGASNVANAVAPLVGNGSLSMNAGVALAGGAIGLGALTIARRTLETMGNDLTELPLTAALVVAAVSSTLVTGLSWIGVPASFVVIATMSIVGLGWGRATTAAGLPDDPRPPPAELGAPVGAADAPGAVESSAPGPVETDVDETAALYRPATTARVVLLQNLVPGVATAAAYLVFSVVGALPG